MTHEEILQLLYDETLVGNAPVVRQAVEEYLAKGWMDDGTSPFGFTTSASATIGAA